MPELPEIEHLRRSLAPEVLGARVMRVLLKRSDVVHRFESESRVRPKDLLAGSRIVSMRRHGKNLALIGNCGAVICIHLGMSGQLQLIRARDKAAGGRHAHCIWTLNTKRGAARLIFRDPRRFGGIWTFPSFTDLRSHRWASLGPDALNISAANLANRLATRNRPIKAALLEQSIVAGIGNIYADECLFASGIHPLSIASRLAPARLHKLAAAIRRVMRSAIRSGGSTIRSYIDGNGRGGTFAKRHLVYGRAGAPCLRCGTILRSATIAQRTSVFCPQCQRLKGR